MGYCNRCGKQIDDRYLLCFECNSESKIFIDDNGYQRFKDSNTLVHRWVAEKKLGRPLYPGEVVHHIDRDKTNNDERNLWVFNSQEAHDAVHEADAIKYGSNASYRGFDNQKNIQNSKNLDIIYDGGTPVKKVSIILKVILLIAAIVIDFADLLPLDIIGLGYIYELPLAGIQGIFLFSVGVPAIKTAFQTGWDLLPIIDVMPWCTLAILDKYFNLKIPLITRLFNN